MNLGKLIKSNREARGMTQEQLAKKVGCATITIRQYEAGKREPRFEIADKIAEALGISVFELIGYENDEWKFVEEITKEEVVRRYEIYDAVGRLSLDAIRDLWSWLEGYLKIYPNRVLDKPIELNMLFPLKQSPDDQGSNKMQVAAHGGGVKKVPAPDPSKEKEIERLTREAQLNFLDDDEEF